MGLAQQVFARAAAGGRGQPEQRVVGLAGVEAAVQFIVRAEQVQEADRVGEIGDPATAEHLCDRALSTVVHEHFPFLVDQRRGHAQHLLPHGRHRDRHAPVHRRGVVAEFQPQPGRRSRRGIQAPGLGFALGLGRFRHCHGAGPSPEQRRRHDAVCGYLARAQHSLGEDLPVDGQRQRAPQVRIARQRRTFQVQAQPEAAQVRRNPQGIGVVLGQPIVAARGNGLGDVQFTGAKARQLAAGVLDRVPGDRVQRQGVAVRVVRIGFQAQVPAGHALGQHEHAVHRVLAAGFHGPGVQRKRDRVRQQLEEPRRGPLQLDLQHVRGRRTHAQRPGIGLAGQQRGGTRHRLQQGGRMRGAARVERAPPRAHEVLRDHRRAVAPARIGAQPETVLQAVRRQVPALGGSRHRFPRRVECDQAFAQIAQHLDRGQALGLVDVQRVGFGPQAAPKLGRHRGCGEQAREPGGQEKGRPDRQKPPCVGLCSWRHG